MVLAHCGSLQLDPAALMKVLLATHLWWCMHDMASSMSCATAAGDMYQGPVSPGMVHGTATLRPCHAGRQWHLHFQVHTTAAMAGDSHASCALHRCITSWWCWSACTGGQTSALEPAWRLSPGPACCTTEHDMLALPSEQGREHPVQVACSQQQPKHAQTGTHAADLGPAAAAEPRRWLTAHVMSAEEARAVRPQAIASAVPSAAFFSLALVRMHLLWRCCSMQDFSANKSCAVSLTGKAMLQPAAKGMSLIH